MSAHPKYQLPDDPHAKVRYASAMKHVEAAKTAGKSTDEIHEIFRKVMAYKPGDVESIPKDEAHKKFRMAVIHAKKALADGKSSEEAHDIFRRVMESSGEGHCSHAK